MDRIPSLSALIYQRTIALDKDLGNSASLLLNIWIYFNLISNNILLPILVLTILFSKQLRRHPTFINLCLTWIFSGVFSLLLFYADQYRVPEPPKALCVAQSSLLFGIIPMWGVAVLSFFYYVFQSLQGQSHRAGIGRGISWLMLGGPYFFQIAFSAAALIISLRHPDLVGRQRIFFHCGPGMHPLLLVRIVFVTLCAVCVSVLEILLLRNLYRGYSGIRRLALPESYESIRSTGPYVMRILIFGLYAIFGTIVDLITIIDPSNVLPQMYLATAGTAVFLIFGTQVDVLRVWFPCLFRCNRPNRVYQRPYRRPSSHSQSRSDSSHIGLQLEDSTTSRAWDRTQLSRVPSERPSFTLDDLFPAVPPPARVVGMSYQYTHLVM
ncbi:hypothetical protein P691DRAFT_779776 [Macrolepiota fuliginosa MF-IS2]|uniref:Uncharacterized protein n=1 Tax=Macrolepiota fuliginosa MF-IS2 TaxID=1400762 RepID=A0A9P6BXH7_9AGAR|nr:hypothetical protein P691DRAFT_779776 [Macrolepiota fuliginosa MF-IS2]